MKLKQSGYENSHLNHIKMPNIGFMVLKIL